MASWVWLCHEYHLDSIVIPYITMFFGVIMSLLMVSNIRYHSFKQIDLKGKVSFLTVLMMVIIFVAVASNPATLLFLLALSYAVSGPTQTLYIRHKMRLMRRKIAKKNA
jgi:CDP-diacylglycerol--serine O-phosphatidyltransferase